MQRVKYLASACLLSTLALTLAGCSRGVDAAQAAGRAEPSTAPLVTALADRNTTTIRKTEFVASGPIVVENQIDVLSQRDGIVLKVFADIGKRVRKGEVLATLDSSQLEADRAVLEHALRANADNARFHETEQGVNQADLDRAEKMFAAGLITKEQLDHTRFLRDATVWEIEREHENQQQSSARIRSLDLEISKTRIVAPFDGVVARRYVRAGQKVAPNDRLFWVTAQRPLLVRFTLPQEFLLSVRKGGRVSVSAPFAENAHYNAEIVAVSPVVDPASGTIEVVARLTGSTGILRPGMTANVHVDAR